MSNMDQAPTVAIKNTEEGPAAPAVIPLWWGRGVSELARGILWVAVVIWTQLAIDRGFLPGWTGVGVALGTGLCVLAAWGLVESVVAAVLYPSAASAVGLVAGRGWRAVLDDILMAVVLAGIAIPSLAAVRQGPVPAWVFFGSLVSFGLAVGAAYGVELMGRDAFLAYRRRRWQRLQGASTTRCRVGG